MDNVPKEAEFEAYLKNGLQPLVDAIKSRVSTDVTPPILVLFTLDEAGGLSNVRVGSVWDGDDDGSTCYDVLLSALQDFEPRNPYFIIALSTHSRLDLRAAMHRRVNHARGVGPYAFHPAPWTEVPFDCSISLRGRPIYRPGTMTLDDAATAEYMAKYGRPVYVVAL